MTTMKVIRAAIQKETIKKLGDKAHKKAAEHVLKNADIKSSFKAALRKLYETKKRRLMPEEEAIGEEFCKEVVKCLLSMPTLVRCGGN